MPDILEPVALGLATPALVARVQELTQQALAAWSRRWAIAAHCEVRAAEAVRLPAGSGMEFARELGAAPGAVLALPADLRDAVATALFGAKLASRPAEPAARAADADEPPVPAEALGEQAAQAVVDDLRRVLSQTWQVRTWTIDAAPQATPGRWHALVEVEIEAAGRRVRAWLPGLRFKAAATAAPAVRAPVVKAATACAALETSLLARVGRAELAIADIVQLQPGDVLVLDAALDQPISLSLEDDALELRAYLGAAPDGRRAVRAAVPPRS